MDNEILQRLYVAIKENNIPISTSKQVKNPVTIVFNAEFFKSENNLRILQACGISPLDLLSSSKKSKTIEAKAAYISIISINKEYLVYDIKELLKNNKALSHCISDLIHHWNSLRSGFVKQHRTISTDITDCYIRARKSQHPDEDRLLTHDDILQAVANYHIYVKIKDNENPDLFLPHQWKSLHVFLRSKSAIPSYFIDRQSLSMALENGKSSLPDNLKPAKPKKIVDLGKLTNDLVKEWQTFEEWSVSANQAFADNPGLKQLVESKIKDQTNAS